MSNSAKKPMKAVSVPLPWATLISIGAQTIAPIKGAVSHRGLIAVHAPREYPPELQVLERRPEFYSVLHHDGKYSDPRRDAGCVIAAAELVACVKVEYLIDGRSKYSALLTDQERALGCYETGWYGWILRNVSRLTTKIPCRGAGLLWTLPPDVELAMLGELCA